MTKPEKSQPYIRSVYVDPVVWAELAHEALRQDRKVNWLVVRAIKEYLERLHQVPK